MPTREQNIARIREHVKHSKSTLKLLKSYKVKGCGCFPCLMIMIARKAITWRTDECIALAAEMMG